MFPTKTTVVGGATLIVVLLFCACFRVFGRLSDLVGGLLVFALYGLVIWFFSFLLFHAIRSAMYPSKETRGETIFGRLWETPGQRKWKHDVYDENAYAILGIPQAATPAEIRQAFRNLGRQHHPDAVKSEDKEAAALLFARIDQAYELLSDVDKRRRYDAWIEYLCGGEPPLDEATRVLGDKDNFAEFDEMLNPEGLPPEEGSTPEPTVSTPTAPRSVPNPLSHHEEEPATEEGTPTEVDIPDAVREALGLTRPDPVDPERP